MSSSHGGRGRGISNEPAWMTRGDFPAPSSNSPSQNATIGAGNHRSATPERSYRHDKYRADKYDRDKGQEQYSSRSGGGSGRSRDFRGDHPPYRRRGGGGGSRSSSSRPRQGGAESDRIVFRSYREEREWVEERRRKRRDRKTLFDVLPTEEQIALEELQKASLASHGPNPNVFLKPEDRVMESSIPALAFVTKSSNTSSVTGANITTNTQQTRHARKLYVGNIPDGMTDHQVHTFFRDCIFQAMSVTDPSTEEDPVLSVNMNQERHYAFIEFRSVEVTTACLACNGIHMDNDNTATPLVIKRPNDYNSKIAPIVTLDFFKQFDLSKLGIVSPFVPDSPHKIFVDGLPFHLQDEQVKELLSAFGKLKAFHLVKLSSTSAVTQGYCFVEYVDENIRDIAIMCLNGMDLGGGKKLKAKLASERENGEGAEIGTAAMSGSILGTIDAANVTASPVLPLGVTSIGVSKAPPIMKYVDGVDIEALVDVAVGGPGKKIVASIPDTYDLSSAIPNNTLDIANAALAALAAPVLSPKTRILVLHNMVSEHDFDSEDDYNGLKEEVEEECKKFGNLISLKIPRPTDQYPLTALKKIYLEYATTEDAANAEHELSGRKFGESVVVTSFFNESEYGLNMLS
jgi:splicing factor U2AF 65 kDa subunit